MNSVLVLGGNDFVGSALAKYLIKLGYKVDVFTQCYEKISYKGVNRHIICDRNNKDDVMIKLNGKEYSYIFDITAKNKKDIEYLLNSIDRGNLKKYIMLSAGAVYKDGSNRAKEIREKGENINWGDYSLFMKEAEDYIIGSNTPYIIVRSTYIYGENNNQYRETYFFDRIKAGKEIPVPKGKKVSNQFIYIDDLIKVLVSLMKSAHTREDYNVTNPQLISWNELIETCGEIVGKTPIIIPIDVENVRCDERCYFPFKHIDFNLDINKLIEHGVYIPNILLKEGLTKTYKWYNVNKPKISDDIMDKIDYVLQSKSVEKSI